MRTVYKARLVPDTAPDGLTTKVIKVEDLGVAIEIALGRLEAASDSALFKLYGELSAELDRRMTEGAIYLVD